MSIFKRRKKSQRKTIKSTLPDYITGQDPCYTYGTHVFKNDNGSKRIAFYPVRKNNIKVKKSRMIDGKDSDKWFLKIDL